MFFELFGVHLEGGAIGFTKCVTTKCCADDTSHPETRTSRVGFGFLWAKGTLSMDSSNLGE